MEHKKTVAILLLFASLLSFLACSSGKAYTYCEIGIEIPRSYRRFDAEGDYDMAFKDGRSVIGIRRFSFEAVVEDGILSTHTAFKFAEIYRERLEGVSPSPMREHGYIPYFTYTRYSGGTSYTYMPAFFRTPYAYYMVVLVSENGINDGGRVKFLEILDTFYILPEYL